MSETLRFDPKTDEQMALDTLDAKAALFWMKKAAEDISVLVAAWGGGIVPLTGAIVRDKISNGAQPIVQARILAWRALAAEHPWGSETWLRRMFAAMAMETSCPRE